MPESATGQARMGTAAAAVLVGAGWVVAVAALGVAGIGALSCGLSDGSCGAGARTAITGGLVVAGLALVIPPAVAVWATRQRVWATAPAIAVVSVLIVGALSAARHAATLRHEQVLENGARRLASQIPGLVAFPAPPILAPSTPVNERDAAAIT